MVSHLESRPLVATRTEIDAVPGRLQQAIEKAAKRLEPQVQTLALERTTLRNQADVQAWFDRTKKMLIQAVQHGPVLMKARVRTHVARCQRHKPADRRNTTIHAGQIGSACAVM